MKKVLISNLFVLTLLSPLFCQEQAKYPLAPKDTISDSHFGDEVDDPYQWMENLADPRLPEWLNNQELVTKKVSNQQVRKKELRSQLASMYNDVNRDKTNEFIKRKEEFTDKYEFDYQSTNYNKSYDLMYRERDRNNYRLLIKAKDYIEAKNDKIDYNIVVNEEDNLAIVAISINGKDWSNGYVFDLKSAKKLPYTLTNLNGSNIKWFKKILYFDAYDTPSASRDLKEKAKGQKLYKLEIGIDSIPQLIYSNPDTTGTNRFHFTIEEDNFFLYSFIESRSNIYKTISCADLNVNFFFPKNFLLYPNEGKINLNIVHVSNDSIWLRTNWNAPNGKILLANLNIPNKLTEFVPEYDIVLDKLNPLGKNKLALTYLSEGQSIALIYNHSGELLKRIDFPKGKKVRYLYENDDVNHTTFNLSSFFHPDLTYQISLDDLEFKPIESLTVPYNVDKLETRYVSYESKDGTEVSMYITCQKDLPLDGNNPVMLHGYGGYGSRVDPFFDQSNALFIAHGGILAVPNIRGGGAKGSDWASEGRRLNKQNSIDDFISAAEYLIEKGYTNPEKLLISGSSHGALLVTAAMTQRPELFNTVIAEAGPYDMLRFHKYTVGGVNTNISEFGTPENEGDYWNLKSYSPLHNIKEEVKYPNLLLVTGTSDDRVPPFHSYKFLATLQEKASSKGQYILFTTIGAGHSGTLTQNDFEEKILFKYYFIFDNLGIDFY